MQNFALDAPAFFIFVWQLLFFPEGTIKYFPDFKLRNAFVFTVVNFLDCIVTDFNLEQLLKAQLPIKVTFDGMVI